MISETCVCGTRIRVCHNTLDAERKDIREFRAHHASCTIGLKVPPMKVATVNETTP